MLPDAYQLSVSPALDQDEPMPPPNRRAAEIVAELEHSTHAFLQNLHNLSRELAKANGYVVGLQQAQHELGKFKRRIEHWQRDHAILCAPKPKGETYGGIDI